MADALILTLRLDEGSFARLDDGRRRWFPHRGYRLPAHLTLFHRLPGDDLDAITAHLDDLAGRLGPLPLRFDGIVPFGGGTGLAARSDALVALRAALAAHWRAVLTRQDQRFRPHVTVQNKVPPETAARDRLDIGAALRPWEGHGTGFLLWHYRGGPWEAAWSARFGA